MFKRVTFTIMFLWKIRLSLLLPPSCYMIFLACAGSAPRDTRNVYPPGVDSTVVRNAFLEADRLFVTPNETEHAEKDKEIGFQQFKLYLSLDSLNFPEDTLQGKTLLRQKIQILTINEGLKKEVLEFIAVTKIDTALQILSREKMRILGIANGYFENSYRQNPFDIDLLIYYARTLTLLGKSKGADPGGGNGYFQKSEDIVNQALSMDRGGHDIYYYLAENYYAIKNWKKANEYFRLALETMDAFEFLPEDFFSESFEPFVNPSERYKYLYKIGDTYVKLYESDLAIQAFDDARPFASSERDGKRLEDYIRWIDWADGNIHAREKFETAEILEGEGRYREAAETYLEVIDDTRNSAQRAYLESSWRLSKVEVGFLMEDNDYLARHGIRNVGLNRLRGVVREIPKDSLGIPQDTIYIAYFNDFARMLWNDAEKLNKVEGDKHEARELFAEGAVLHSDLQAKNCLQMTQFMQNARYEGLLWALKTYSLRRQLDGDEMVVLDRFFKRVTQKARYGVLSKFFNEQFQFHLRKVPPTMGIEDEIMAYEYLRSSYSYLDYFLKENYGVRQDPMLLRTYSRLYRTKANQLSPGRLQEVEDRITDFYARQHRNRPDEKRIFDDWWKRLTQIRRSRDQS